MARQRPRSVPRGAVPVRPDYLKALGDDVEAGLALVVHDLVETGAMDRADAEAAVRILAAHHTGYLSSIDSPISAACTAVWVAESIQEDIIEGRQGEQDLTWPRCPDHPNHPLWLLHDYVFEPPRDRRYVDAVWACLTTKRPVAELGRL